MRTLPLALCVLALGCADTTVAPSDTADPDVPSVIDPSEPNDPTDPEDPPGVASDPESLCSVTTDTWTCPYDTVRLSTGWISWRDVHFQVPDGTPPADGWPVAILFQGSFYSAEYFWEARTVDPFGAWNQTKTVDRLLDAGFAVITPEAQVGGNTFWNTNIFPWSVAWESSPDHGLMLALFEGLEDGTFGDVDPDRLYAGGISSGGYMSSRMALSYPGRFSALAIQSASWATCGGLACVVPNDLPADHPPTLFLHGDLDVVVPIVTMTPYAAALDDAGVDQRVVTDDLAGHEWIDAAPDEVVDWFLSH